jgi:hypothetical protein
MVLANPTHLAYLHKPNHVFKLRMHNVRVCIAPHTLAETPPL